jgi:LEA14-like dessication related protein
MNRKSGVFLLLLLLALTVGTACSRAFQQPSVALAGVRVGGIGLRGGLVYVQIDVDNPNSYALEAGRLAYDLDLRDDTGTGENWVKLAKGEFEQSMRVPGHGKTTVEIPIEFTYAGMGSAVKTVLDKGTFNYRVAGNVGVTSPVRTTVPFQRTGVVSMVGVR